MKTILGFCIGFMFGAFAMLENPTHYRDLSVEWQEKVTLQNLTIHGNVWIAAREVTVERCYFDGTNLDENTSILSFYSLSDNEDDGFIIDPSRLQGAWNAKISFSKNVARAFPVYLGRCKEF